MQADATRRTLTQAATARAAKLGRPVLASVTRPTTWRDPIAFFAEAADVQHRALWLRPSNGEALVGIGSARSLIGHGDDRFDQVTTDWRQLIADAIIDDPTNRCGPLLLGGFSFDPAREPTRLWAGFPDARLVLPERLLAIQGGGASLTSNVVAETSTHTDERVAHDRLRHPTTAGHSAEKWQALVGSITDRVRASRTRLRKVVLALAVDVQPTRTLEEALRNLAANYPSCTIFALTNGDACFIGATPERLISLHDGTATTMALAGSAPRGETPSDDDRIAAQLLNDSKERTEHALVVTELRENLAQVCSRVVADAQPRVRTLSNVQHLLTPIRGQVEQGRSVLELVERLHPTPAVGGFPRRAALDLIRQYEALDRGWYAGPIGWVNGKGAGEFVVGLRSAIVRGEVATLFAGCGIVAESQPATEYAEWGWKLRPMQEALGVD